MEKKFITIRDTSDNLIALNINAIKYLEARITKEGEMLTKINGEFGDTESFFVKRDIGEIVDYINSRLW